jgi:hypothetical protein
VEEVAHLFPGRGLDPRILPPERLVERGEPFMRLPVGAVELEEGAGERGRVRGDEPEVGQRRRRLAEDRVAQRLPHVGHDPFGLAARQLGDVEAEFGGEREHDRGRDRAVVVLHLVEVGERNAELLGENLLREPKPRPGFPQLGAGKEFAGIMCFANPRAASTEGCKSPRFRQRARKRQIAAPTSRSRFIT